MALLNDIVGCILTKAQNWFLATVKFPAVFFDITEAPNVSTFKHDPLLSWILNSVQILHSFIQIMRLTLWYCWPISAYLCFMFPSCESGWQPQKLHLSSKEASSFLFSSFQSKNIVGAEIKELKEPTPRLLRDQWNTHLLFNRKRCASSSNPVRWGLRGDLAL